MTLTWSEDLIRSRSFESLARPANASPAVNISRAHKRRIERPHMALRLSLLLITNNLLGPYDPDVLPSSRRTGLAGISTKLPASSGGAVSGRPVVLCRRSLVAAA